VRVVVDLSSKRQLYSLPIFLDENEYLFSSLNLSLFLQHPFMEALTGEDEEDDDEVDDSGLRDLYR